MKTGSSKGLQSGLTPSVSGPGASAAARDGAPAGGATAPGGETLLSEDRVRRHGERVGVQGYTDKTVGAVDAGRSDLLESSARITRCADAAARYAAVGKFELAGRRIALAEQLLARLEARAEPVPLEPENVHPGMWANRPQGEDAAVGSARDAIERARAAVTDLQGATPVNDSKAPAYDRVVMLFGSSCNPPTYLGGHAGIATWGASDARVDIFDDEQPEAARENVPVDEVWVLPVYKHIFSTKSDLLDFDTRMNLARLNFEDIPGYEGKIAVKDIERQVMLAALERAEQAGEAPESVRIGSIDVMEFLQASFPKTRFVLALGGDTANDLRDGKWRRGDELQEKTPILIIPRAGVDGVEGAEANAPRLTNISSTQVRGSTDLEFLAGALRPSVLEAMIDGELYGFSKEQTA